MTSAMAANLQKMEVEKEKEEAEIEEAVMDIVGEEAELELNADKEKVS